MNGRAARRIRRAAKQTSLASRKEQGKHEGYSAALKRLKREYRARPYHQRTGLSYAVLSHKAQERRWRASQPRTK
jgi:hypothetical protein